MPACEPAEFSPEEPIRLATLSGRAAADEVPFLAQEGDVLRRKTSAGSSEGGFTLLDTVVGIALLVLVFVGIASAFQLSVSVVTNNKAEAGAIALADERMEYIRSLSYSAIGTVGGVPSGTIPQSETVSLNGVTYTRRTTVEYVDDPADGLGASDTNGITADYKTVRVDLSWPMRNSVQHVVLVGHFSPTNGVETNPCTGSCGTLVINATNAAGAVLPGASVSITNSSVSPAVSITTFTNASGVVSLIGTPAGTGYHVVVTEPGYSTAQTYTADSQNTDPTPADLTVSNDQTTAATFAIDTLGSKTIQTYAWLGGQSTTTIGNVAFTLQGAKTIGSGPSGTLYKYSANLTTGGSGSVTVSDLEWDTYTVSIAGSTGYDIASACDPQPEELSPGQSLTSTFYLVAHTTNSLLVDVRAQSSGALIPNAYVVLSKSGFSESIPTDPCGQAFFSGLSVSSDYTAQVGASGYATSTTNSVDVSGTTRLSVQLN